MKALAADHSIKRVFGKRQIFAVTDHKFYALHFLSFGDLDHFWCQVNTGIMLIRIFLMQQRQHRTCSAAAVQKIVKRLFFKLCQYVWIILFTHLIDTGAVRFIDLGCFGKLSDG